MHITLDRVSVPVRSKWILHNISAEIPAGRLTMVAGHNGSGKTTLMRSMAGLVKDWKGGIQIAGVDSRVYSRDQRCKIISWNPERMLVPFAFSAEEIVQLGYHPWQNQSNAQVKLEARLDCLFQQLAIEHLRSRLVKNLSSGEWRLVSLARALIGHQKVLLLDEPTANLDRWNSKKIMSHLQELRSCGKSICVATHDLEIIRNYADHLLVLEKGHLKFHGCAKKLFNNRAFRSHFSLDETREDK